MYGSDLSMQTRFVGGRFKARGRRLGGTWAGVLAVASLLPAPALAQTDAQRAGARAAATAGAQAFVENRWSDAADLFARAEGVVHSPVQVLYLARSYEKLGQLVKAREAYLRIVNESIAPGAPEPWRDAKTDAQTESAALEPRIPYVTIEVEGAPSSSVHVTMDGVEVLSAFVGVPQPVDPGVHELKATAAGKADAVAKVSIVEAKRETVVLTFATQGTAVAAGAPPEPATASGPKAVGPALPLPVADAAQGVSPLTWAAFGVGAVGLGVGTVFALKTSSKLEEANGLCTVPTSSGGQACSDDKQSQINALDDSARSAKTLAIVGFVAGGVGVAAGVTLLVLSPGKNSSPPASTGMRPWIGLGAAGVRGRF